MNKEFGYVRVGACVPSLKVGNVNYNTEEIIKMIKELNDKGVEIVSFPECSLTGYTCADLFLQDVLLESTLNNLEKILEVSKSLEMVIIVGAPLLIDNGLYNTGIVINKGKILGVVPKTYIPNYCEFYEKRWFNSADNLVSKEIKLLGRVVPVGVDLLFRDENNSKITFGLEICEDVWVPRNPSLNSSLNGATMIFNLSASNEVIGKDSYRRNLLKINSAKNINAYIYASAGINESTTDLAFGGYAAIIENGTILEENKIFNFESNYIIQDIDVDRIINNRLRNQSFTDIPSNSEFRIVKFTLGRNNDDLLRVYAKYPFVPKNESKRKERCNEIINIQAYALAKRLKHTNIKKCVMGISGGLDSTLAFLVVIKAYQILNIDNKNLIAVTMPGFGTTNRTYNNALKLMESYGVTIREVDIKEACLVHFKDIKLDDNDRSVAYENTQARERTQILMDIANLENGLVIGTGDLSELALGWCTYNGDHMSMYAVNSSIPKTLVRYLVEYFADIETNLECKKTILDILDTPISPELLPPNELGEINQKTESLVGPYILHDFFLYHFLRYGATPKKIKFIACKTFEDMYKLEEIEKWLKFFFKKFFSQQFKRSCLPDGPKVGTISLSPRGDLRMPSDADGSIWLDI
ncbi:MAG: NAD(+) synthase [Ruminococcus sp.]|nr:NAD(+) synthase [Ruminococcus sp.]